MRFVPNEWRRGQTRMGTECDSKEQQGQHIVRRTTGTRQRVEPALLGTHGLAPSSVARSPWKLASPAPDHSGDYLAHCAPQAEQVQTLPWAGIGGLSEAVTQTLFPLLNCTCG